MVSNTLSSRRVAMRGHRWRRETSFLGLLCRTNNLQHCGAHQKTHSSDSGHPIAWPCARVALLLPGRVSGNGATPGSTANMVPKYQLSESSANRLPRILMSAVRQSLGFCKSSVRRRGLLPKASPGRASPDRSPVCKRWRRLIVKSFMSGMSAACCYLFREYTNRRAISRITAKPQKNQENSNLQLLRVFDQCAVMRTGSRREARQIGYFSIYR